MSNTHACLHTHTCACWHTHEPTGTCIVHVATHAHNTHMHMRWQVVYESNMDPIICYIIASFCTVRGLHVLFVLFAGCVQRCCNIIAPVAIHIRTCTCTFLFICSICIAGLYNTKKRKKKIYIYIQYYHAALIFFMISEYCCDSYLWLYFL